MSFEKCAATISGSSWNAARQHGYLCSVSLVRNFRNHLALEIDNLLEDPSAKVRSLVMGVLCFEGGRSG